MATFRHAIGVLLSPATAIIFVTCGLFSPYPFGDGSPDEFMANDSFDFKVGPTRLEYRCDVETTFFPGDGFALATAQNTPPGWSLSVKFYNSAGMKPHGDTKLDLI